jgi:hypothetical protein
MNMFRDAKAHFFLGYEKTPFHDYRELRARYDGQFGKGEDNPFHRIEFDAEDDKQLYFAVACGRVFYDFLDRKPSQFDQLVEFLVRGYFSRHVALCAAARVLREVHS